MFNAGSVASGLSFSKIIGGISKTLGIANQVIPIYKEFKPIIGNVGTMFNIFKEFSNSSGSTSSNSNIVNVENVAIKNSVQNTSNPTFFQ